MSTRSHSSLVKSLFDYLDEIVEPRACLIFREPTEKSDAQALYQTDAATKISHYPSTFWAWVAQFDTSDNLLPLFMATCHWDYIALMGGESYVFMLDNHPECRTYLMIEAVNESKYQSAAENSMFDILQLFASRWQCVRAETEAAREYKNRDIKEAKYLDAIKQREQFIDNMKLVQQLAVEMSNLASLDELHRFAVESIREKLGFDRAIMLLLDMKKRCFSGTYGTNEEGDTVSEHHTQYDLHQLEEDYINALFEGEQSLVIVDDAPLYSAGKVVGQGWNGMLILRDGDEIIGWVALDNYINRLSITSYQKQMLESFGSLLAQIYIRKRQEQNVRMLHASMVELSRCTTIRDVCRSAVAYSIKRLGIDRLAVFLTDPECTYMQGTWGTDIHGNVVDESYYRSETQDRTIVNMARAHPNEVVFEESVPIYHDFNIVGFGWTAMTMLTNNSGEPIAFIAADNLIKRTPLTSQLREMIRMFASNLTEVMQKTSAQEAVHELNENLEKEVKSRTRELQQANEKLDLMSKMDPLTRLGNRRMLEHLLEDLCCKHGGDVVEYGVILVDIDHFGLFNNDYGHLEGDIALMRVGNILKHHAEIGDETFCRIGGEEFVLLVTNKTEQQIATLAECIRDCIETEKIPHKSNTASEYLTVSIGYHVMPFEQNSFNFNTVYDSADKALYLAKDRGRNLVCGMTDDLVIDEAEKVTRSTARATSH